MTKVFKVQHFKLNMDTLNFWVTRLLFLLLCSLTAHICLAKAVNERISKAESLFFNGEYTKAEKILTSIDFKSEDVSQAEKIKYFVLRARISSAFERDGDVSLWLSELYDQDPNHEFDPYVDSPQMIYAWNQIKKKRAKELPEERKNFMGTGLKESELKEKSKFWAALLPFGFGHFATEQYQPGFMFLFSELLLIYLNTGGNGYLGQNQGTGNSFTTFAFAGAWSYEVLDLMPYLYAQNPKMTNRIRYFMSIAPFGAGQGKNGEWFKALGIGATQLLFWQLTLTSDNTETQDIAQFGIVLSYLYGVYDAWINHQPLSGDQATATRIEMTPFVSLGNKGNPNKFYGAQLTYRF